MQTQQAIRYLAHPTGYGLGLELMTYKGVSCIGHSGSFSTFGSQLLLFPDKHLALILMVSRISFMKRLLRELLDHLLDLPSESQRPGNTSPERTQWSRYTGSFLGARAGLAMISVKDNHLVLELNNQRLILQSHSDNVYFGYQPGSEIPLSVGFIPEAMKPVRYITIDEKLCERFERDPLFSPNPLSWIHYNGTYKENDSGETITIQITNGQLLLRFHDNDDDIREGACIPISETRFAWTGGLIEFQVVEDGTVPALIAMKVYEFRHLFA